MEPGMTQAPSQEAAEQALAYLAEMSPDVRGGAILAGDGSPLAASGEGDRWAEVTAELLAAADRAEGQPLEQIHVATEQGEVFALRAEGLTALVVTERFVLASLMVFDMRAVLRDLAAPASSASNGGA
jgi:predicted regulator of Ras-like GTPase activity (Roadblock/LC7/MglB family)